jgi:hypothetical protein
MERSSRLIHRVGDAGRLRHGFCLTAHETETARIPRQSRDEQSIAMRTSVALWCKGSGLRSVGATQFYAVVDAADNMPVPWCQCTNTNLLLPANLPTSGASPGGHGKLGIPSTETTLAIKCSLVELRSRHRHSKSGHCPCRIALPWQCDLCGAAAWHASCLAAAPPRRHCQHSEWQLYCRNQVNRAAA